MLRRFQKRFPLLLQDERWLVQAAREGSHEAFDALMRLHETLLHGFLVRRVGATAADDVLQETRMACWQAMPRYAKQARFKSWLFGIACHKCADYFRQTPNAGQNVALTSIQMEDHAVADSYSVIENRILVKELLDSLPPTEKEILELYYYGELTLAEIASLVGRSLNTVKSQFYRAHVRAVSRWQTVMATPETQPESDCRKGISLS